MTGFLQLSKNQNGEYMKLQEKDPLDKLRIFLKEQIKYGIVKPELEVQDGQVILIRINLGDVTLKLK